MVKYPSVEDIIVINNKVLEAVVVKRADKHKVLSKHKIADVLNATRRLKGDIYDKAVALFKGLVQAHPFASGNRRTAFVTVENFLFYNGEKPKVKKNGDVTIIQGVREGYYGNAEIKSWLKGGDMREFKR